MKDSLLFIDDEPHILTAIERIFDEGDVRVLTASGALAGLELLAQEEIAVMVTDNMMPGINGLEVLRRAREISPDTVRIMLTGHADINTAIAAINDGEVFRFVMKPWDNTSFSGIVYDALQRYRIVKKLRNGNEAVMLSIAQTIELKDPYTRGHCDRVAKYALMISEELGLSNKVMEEIKHGSWLHDCGKIGVADNILNSSDALNQEEYSMVKNHTLWGAEVARLARLSERVVNIILYHHEHYDGGGYPSGLKGSDIPLEARIVCVADAFDAMTTDRPYRQAYPRKECLDIISAASGKLFDANVVKLFLSRMERENQPLSESFTEQAP